MSERYCPSCGAPLGDPRRFCPECGAALTDRPRGQRGLLWLILGGGGCLGALMLLACAGLLLFTMRGGLAAALDAPTPTALVTATPAAEATPVATEPAPTPAGDAVLLFDDFSNPRRSTLREEEDEISRSAFDAGAFLIEVKEAETLAWALADGAYGDVIVEADSAVEPGSEIVAAGLVFHYQNSRNFYLFSVSSDGYYALEILADDEWQTLIDWTPSDAIDAARNSLRVEMKGDRIAMLVNGELLEVTEDATLSGGDAGLAVSSFEASQVTIRFDNLLITRNP